MIIVTARLERVGVRPEFLPGCVALPLQRLTRGKVEAEKRGDPPVCFGDDRVAPVEVACLAGPVLCDADIVGDL